MPLSTTPPSIVGRRLAQQPLEVHHAQVAAGRRGHRRPGHEHLRGDGRATAAARGSGPAPRRRWRPASGSPARRSSRCPAVPGQVVQQRADRRRPRPAPSGRAAPPAPAWAARRAGRRRRRGPSPPARRRRAPGPARRGSPPGRARAAPRARRRGARRRARRRPRCAARRAGPAGRWPGRPGACPPARRAATAVPCVVGGADQAARPRSHSSWCRCPRRVEPAGRARGPRPGSATSRRPGRTPSRRRPPSPAWPPVSMRDLPVEQLLQHQQLVRALLEPAQVERAGAEHDRVGVDRGDPADRQEDPPPQRHLGDQPDDLRRAVGRSRSRATASRTRPTWSPLGSKTAQRRRAGRHRPWSARASRGTSLSA